MTFISKFRDAKLSISCGSHCFSYASFKRNAGLSSNEEVISFSNEAAANNHEVPVFYVYNMGCILMTLPYVFHCIFFRFRQKKERL